MSCPSQPLYNPVVLQFFARRGYRFSFQTEGGEHPVVRCYVHTSSGTLVASTTGETDGKALGAAYAALSSDD